MLTYSKKKEQYMTKKQLEQLIRLADAASQGDWFLAEGLQNLRFSDDDAAFIAAANPTTVKALMQAVLDAWEIFMRTKHPWKAISDSEAQEWKNKHFPEEKD